MRRKFISAVLASALVAGSLVGCGQASETAAEPEQSTSETQTQTQTENTETAEKAETTETAESAGEDITLRMAWWGSQDRHDKTIAAIELYESLNPNVTIEYEYYSFDDYFTKLKTLVASDEV